MALDLYKTTGSSPPTFDRLVHGAGTVYLLRPVSPSSAAWLDQHVTPDATTLGGALIVEPRNIRDIVLGAVSDGLRVR